MNKRVVNNETAEQAGSEQGWWPKSPTDTYSVSEQYYPGHRQHGSSSISTAVIDHSLDVCNDMYACTVCV